MNYKVCPVCGKAFAAERNNMKYCSPLCRVEGAKTARKQWEQDNDFLKTQRIRMRQRRMEERDAVRAEKAAEAQRRHAELLEAAEALHKEQLIEVRQRAAEGDLFAQRQLALDGGDWLEYWRLYKEMILETEEQYRSGGFHNIGGEDVHEEHFEYFVMEHLREKRNDGQ